MLIREAAAGEADAMVDSELMHLSPAEGLEHALIRLRRLGVFGELRLVLVGPRQHRKQLFERCIVIPGHCGLDHGLDAMVPRDEGGIDG